MGLTRRATNSLTICSELRAESPGRLRCGLFDWDETAPAFPKWGCMGMSGGYEHAAESIVTIHAALEAGITMLDIGDFYGAR